MNSWHQVIIWLTLMTPLIFSPGPANLACCALSSNIGIRGTWPFILGLSLVNCLVTALIGLSYGFLRSKFLTIFNYIELLGIVYIYYLAFVFFTITSKTKAKRDEQKPVHLGFIKGVLLQLLNGKLYLLLVMMYSQFIKTIENTLPLVTDITVLMVVMGFTSYLFWGAIGSLLNRTLNPKYITKIQCYLFAPLLFVIATHLLLGVLNMIGC